MTQVLVRGNHTQTQGLGEPAHASRAGRPTDGDIPFDVTGHEAMVEQARQVGWLVLKLLAVIAIVSLAFLPIWGN